MEKIVDLNVGGRVYTTTLATLRRYPESMLGAMFGGSMPTHRDSQGRIFIDRDGEMFAHVLNYLRTSTLPDTIPDALDVEADFYQIRPLIEFIKTKRQSKCQLQDQNETPMPYYRMVPTGKGRTLEMTDNGYQSKDAAIVTGSKIVIESLPSIFFCVPRSREQQFNQPNQNLDDDFAWVATAGTYVRLKLGEHLYNYGWTLVSSDSFTIKHGDNFPTITYRDRWFHPDPPLNLAA